MNERMTLEVIAPTVEEAIEKGLDQLGLERKDVAIEILDEGKRNLFRFASRQSRIKLTVLSASDNQAVPVSATQAPLVIEEESEQDELQDYEEDLDFEDEIEVEDDEQSQLSTETDPEQIKLTIQQTTKKLLGLMDTDTAVTVTHVLSEEDDRDYYAIDIEGDDLSFLIGRRAETLNSIQYLLSLMISHKFSRWIPLQVDIQNYRSRRENELQKLARRMADQVVSTGRKQTLEPMPANERRIIHIELRKRDDVYTESVGEDPHRKIFIYPND
ncbi:MAG TPA: KH domain-containing protein [Chloroflexi bacterium]|jgi:spoIIIJ-associated protein|nr:Jag N-terminal domain-containing protein [Anaerolineaceae bacterium]HHX09194.1 KH domain-containing protein [Chloroflexota bacterium]